MLHFSGLGAFNGLAKGKFIEDFVKKSLYGRTPKLMKTSDVTLWRLTRHDVATVATQASPLKLPDPDPGHMSRSPPTSVHRARAGAQRYSVWNTHSSARASSPRRA